MPQNTKVEFDTRPFVKSHLREPRGRGSWAFSLEPDPRNVLKDVIFSPGGMTAAAAKKWARAWLRMEQNGGRIRADLASITLFFQP